MIDAFTQQWNPGSSPFAWVKTADAILAKGVPKRPAIGFMRSRVNRVPLSGRTRRTFHQLRLDLEHEITRFRGVDPEAKAVPAIQALGVTQRVHTARIRYAGDQRKRSASCDAKQSRILSGGGHRLDTVPGLLDASSESDHEAIEGAREILFEERRKARREVRKMNGRGLASHDPQPAEVDDGRAAWKLEGLGHVRRGRHHGRLEDACAVRQTQSVHRGGEAQLL